MGEFSVCRIWRPRYLTASGSAFSEAWSSGVRIRFAKSTIQFGSDLFRPSKRQMVVRFRSRSRFEDSIAMDSQLENSRLAWRQLGDGTILVRPVPSRCRA